MLRREASATTSSAGNLRSARMPSISRPTFPVAPATATLKPIVHSPEKPLLARHRATRAEALLSEKSRQFNARLCRQTRGRPVDAGLRAFAEEVHPVHCGCPNHALTP